MINLKEVIEAGIKEVGCCHTDRFAENYMSYKDMVIILKAMLKTEEKQHIINPCEKESIEQCTCARPFDQNYNCLSSLRIRRDVAENFIDLYKYNELLNHSQMFSETERALKGDKHA